MYSCSHTPIICFLYFGPSTKVNETTLIQNCIPYTFHHTMSQTNPKLNREALEQLAAKHQIDLTQENFKAFIHDIAYQSSSQSLEDLRKKLTASQKELSQAKAESDEIEQERKRVESEYRETWSKRIR